MSAWGHADGTVEPDGFAVEHRIGDDGFDELRVFGGIAEAARVWDLCSEGGAHVLGQGAEHGCQKQSGGDGVHPDLQGCQVPGDGQGGADDAAFGRGVGGLSCTRLADSRDGSGVCAGDSGAGSGNGTLTAR